MDIAILLGLIVLSAVISTAEIGFFAVNETKLRALAQNHNSRARMALHLRSDPQKLLATILVGDRLVTLEFSMPLSIDDPYALVEPLMALVLSRM